MTGHRVRAHVPPAPRPSFALSFRIVGALAGLVGIATCATGSRNVKYPPRRPGCALQVFTSAAPPLPVWDDLGIAEVGCHLDEGEVACMHRLRAEACRMGADILYNVPRRAARPGEREMTMRAPVAHTREPAATQSQAPALSHEPVVPISAAPALADGGAPEAGTRD